MERPIKGGYILISLGLVALSAGASLTVDYERITKTKKHIVLTGIKVADTIMPDVTVKPILGNGTITFRNIYGYDIVVSSNGSAVVSEYVSPEDIPNVEEAPSGVIAEALGLDTNGKVVKGSTSSEVKFYLHELVDRNFHGFKVASTNSIPFTESGTALLSKIQKCFILATLGSGTLNYTGSDSAMAIYTLDGNSSNTFDSTSYTDTVIEL